MLKGGKRKVLAFAMVAAAALAMWMLWPSGPSYRGRSLSHWFYHPAENDGEAFRAMGLETVPFLIRRLEDAPSERIKAWLAKVSPTPMEIYRQNKEMWQHRAAYLLGELGATAKMAEPNLESASTSANWYLRGAATVARMKIRETTIDPLIVKLGDTSDWQAWYETAMMVGQFGASAEPAVPVLLQALQSSNNIIQAHALIALGMIGRQPEKCVPAIVPFLVSGNISDRQKAIGALRGFGTNALPAKMAIEAALADSDPWVRREAAIAMKKLETSASHDR